MIAVDLPWRPAIGKTALRAIAEAGGRVLCEDTSLIRQTIRTLWSDKGRLLMIGGHDLTIAGFVPPTRPEARPAAPAKIAPTGGDLDAAELATLKALARDPSSTCSALADMIRRPVDKVFCALLSLDYSGLASAERPDALTPRAWRLTAAGAQLFRAFEPEPAPIAAPAAPAPAITPPIAVPRGFGGKPKQMDLFA